MQIVPSLHRLSPRYVNYSGRRLSRVELRCPLIFHVLSSSSFLHSDRNYRAKYVNNSSSLQARNQISQFRGGKSRSRSGKTITPSLRNAKISSRHSARTLAHNAKTEARASPPGTRASYFPRGRRGSRANERVERVASARVCACVRAYVPVFFS